MRCASVMGEYCGGIFGVNGRCDEQLVCVVKKQRTYRLAQRNEVGRCGMIFYPNTYYLLVLKCQNLLIILSFLDKPYSLNGKKL